MDHSQAEAKIRESVDRVRRGGVRIIDKRFGVEYAGAWVPVNIGDGRCCCPLGAVLVCEYGKPQRNFEDVLRSLLGVTGEWLDGFLTAFDGAARSEQEFTSHDQSVGFALGAQLRHEYITNKEATDG